MIVLRSGIETMNYETLANKFLLLDTNVLVNTTKYPHQMADIFTRLLDNKITLVLDELVKFEFLRKAESAEELDRLKIFLKELFNISNIDKTDFNLVGESIVAATEIANIYSRRLKNSRIELTDCFLAGQMQKYNKAGDKLFFATSNHKDFPPLLFERIGIETIDTVEDIINIGFYRFRNDSFTREKSAFLTT